MSNPIEQLYLSYVNSFLTVDRFAEYYGISVELANLIIKECQQGLYKADR